MDIGLRGNATHIETSASYICSFENCNLQALFGGIFGSTIASRSSTYDN